MATTLNVGDPEHKDSIGKVRRVQMADWMLGRIEAKASARNWSALPQGFELDAVRSVFQVIKPMFGKTEIRQRVAASKATTFAELREAIA